MALFLLKGLIRDRTRSLFPLLTVIGGVTCTVVLYNYLTGIRNEMVWAHAGFDAGHVKVMSRAYADEIERVPNDLALLHTSDILDRLKADHPRMIWTPRIRFGGLLDIPDENRETRAQSPIVGLAVDLLASDAAKKEMMILNLEDALVRGGLPRDRGEILISEGLAKTLDVGPGDPATLIARSMHGSIATANFSIAGTLHFGMSFIDRSALIADLSDVRSVLDMEDAAGEILGFFPDFAYRPEKADAIASAFNAKKPALDEFSPLMLSFGDQYRNREVLRIVTYFSGIMIGIFVVIMSIVLWNAGLMGSIRRYGEIGVRLAIGERKGRLYRSLIAESMMIGCAGSFVGTALGLAFSYYLQVEGIDISSMIENASVMIVDVLRAQITPASYFIGFLPGFFATFFGTAVASIEIYRRQTANLFKELEA